MKKFFLKKYKHTTLLVAAVIGCIALLALKVPAPIVFTLFALFQLSNFAMSKKCGVLFNSVLTPEQIREFEKICGELKELGAFIPDLVAMGKAEGGWAAIKKLPEELKTLRTRNDELQGDLKKLRKQLTNFEGTSGVKWIGNKPFVTNACAQALTAVVLLDAEKIGALKNVIRDDGARQRILEKAAGYLETEVKTALSSNEIPLPTLYMPQIVELIWKFGQARQYATVYPLGAGTVKLPRLKAGEDDFGFLGVGTAGMSQAVAEKRVTAELVTFTANKGGGLIRIPSEIEEDTFIQFGQFLARYISRQLAKMEDKAVFLADGTGTYANMTGVGPYCVANPTYLTVTANGKTLPTDVTLANFRALRGQVSEAALNGGDVAYYMRPSMEQLLVTFNTIGAPLIYRPAQGGQPASLDGFPIRWIGVGQPYSKVAAPSTFVAFFGDLSYVYLGERGQVRVDVSREVFFATDEIAMRALERIDVEIMAIDAMATLQLAAA